MNSTELRSAFSLAFVYVLRMLGLFMVMPVIAISAKTYPDYSAFLVGLAIGGYGLTQALLQIPMGVLSDKIGRKPVIAGGLVIFAIGSLVAATADSLTWVVVGRFLQGAGAIAGAIMALAGDLSRESQRPKVMAIIGISIGFSFYIALLLGPIIASRFGLSGIFLMTGVLACLCVFLVLFVVPNAKNVAPKGDTLPVIQDLKILFTHPQLARLNISVLLLHMLITLLFVQIPVFLVNLNWPLDKHWQAYSVVLVVSVVGLIGFMAIAKKYKNAVLSISVAGLALVFTLMIFSQQSIIYLLVLVCLFFTCFNYLEANFPAMVSNISPAGKKGSAMGIYASFQFFGAFMGGVLSGSIGELLGIQWVFGLASILCCIWLLLIRGLQATNRLKRYTLKTTTQITSMALQQLSELEGVVDITVVPNEQVMYLKAEQDFDIQQARLVLNLKD
ncbi:MFS transporter [Paraglaciecola psychrophila]|uniref:Major facilitator superfamily transporter n=1 Tax=Paraglaciecola psychrophila 170 TaxID=1129794 RepID=K7AM67_9ALTE|nr:MFS transporter [Paraglaciecola psychrophila]AGH47386.1 major facilitator superfamily transporter [Paraglaciecola psychrophila 170]GAC36485.1 transporter, putative [Paraglaciecola psychrophila 170]